MNMEVKINEKAAVAALAAMKIVMESAKQTGAKRDDETLVRTKQAVMSILKAFRESGHETLAMVITKDFEGVW